MSFLSALGSRPATSTASLAAKQAYSAAAGTQATPASGKVAARLPVVDPVSLSSDGVGLSTQALAARSQQVGGDTLDVAQQFISRFATQLFGDAASGARLSFESATISVASSLAGAAEPSASVDTHSLVLSDSAHFVGKGQIVTTDGQSYAFEIEVQYDATTSAASGARTSGTAVSPDVLALTGRQLPEIEFPGSLADLFKLLGRDLQATFPRKDDGSGPGNLSLRLLRLVNSAALLAPRAQASDTPATAAPQSKVAASYAAEAGAA